MTRLVVFTAERREQLRRQAEKILADEAAMRRRPLRIRLRVRLARLLASMARRLVEPVPGATFDAEASRVLDLAVDAEDRA